MRFFKMVNSSLLNARYRQVLLHSALSGWFMLCRKTLGNESIAKRYLSFGLARSKSTYFKKWVDYTNFRRSKYKLTRRLFLRYASILGRKAFRAWCVNIALVYHERAKIRTFVATWQNNRMIKHLRAWKSLVGETKMAAALKEVDGLILRSVFEKWRRNAMNSRNRYFAMDSLFYMNRVRTSYYFEHWLNCVTREKEVLERFLFIGLMRMKSNYLKHWVQYANYRRSKKSLSAKLSLRHKFSVASKCFKHWSGHVALMTDRRRMIRNFIARWEAMGLRDHFTRWAQKVVRKKFILRQIALSGDEQKKRLLFKVFRDWWNVCERTRKRRTQVEGYIVQNRKAKERQGVRAQFRHWRSLKMLRERKAQMVQENHKALVLSASLKHWKTIAAEKQRLAQIMRDQHDGKVKVRSFESWHAVTKQKVAFRIYRQKQKWFLRWRFEVSLKDSLYDEEAILEQVSPGGLGEENTQVVEDYYPDLLQSSYTKALGDIDLLEIRVANLAAGKADRGLDGYLGSPPRPALASSVLDDTEALLSELDTQSARIKRRLAEFKTP